MCGRAIRDRLRGLLRGRGRAGGAGERRLAVLFCGGRRAVLFAMAPRPHERPASLSSTPGEATLPC